MFSLHSCSDSNSSSLGGEDDSIISIIDTNIKAYIQKNANDPSSYQPIKTTCIDTMMTGEKELFWLRRDTATEKTMILIALRSISEDKEYSGSTLAKLVHKSVEENQEEIKKREKVISEKLKQIDSILQAVKGKQKIEGYVFSHEFRLKNKFGALVLQKRFVRANPKFEITYFGEDRYEFPSVKIEF